MANIATFEAPKDDTLRPTDRAADTANSAARTLNQFARETGAAIGGAVGQVGGQIGAHVDNHIAGQMIGHGSVVSSQLMATLTKQIDDTMSQSDPNDVSVGQGQRENVDKSLQSFQDKFSDAPEKVQNWALATADHMRTHFGNSITAHEMTRAAGAAELNMRNTVRANANTVDLDPASLGATIAKQTMDFDAYVSTHTLRPADVNELRKELDKANGALAYAAGQSVGKKNPDGLFKLLADGAYDKWLNPEQKERLEKFARSEQVYQHEQKQWAYTEKKRAETEANEVAKNGYITAALNGKRVGDYANDPALTAEAKENIRSFQHSLVMQARDKSENTPHPQEWRNLIDQLHTTATKDPNNISDKPIYDALRERRLNKAEFGSALSIFHSIDNPMERQINTYVKRAESFTLQSIEGATMKKVDAAGYADAVNRFELKGRQEIAAARAKGEDVTPLVDPTSKAFVFAPTRFAAMLPTGKEVVKDEADKVRAAEGPAVAGRVGGVPVSSTVREFKTQAEAAAAGLRAGTRVKINGVAGTWQ